MARIMHQRKTAAYHQATIIRFADANTVILDVHLGFGVSLRAYVRLRGIESWELSSSDRARAIAARDALDLRYANTPCTLLTTARGLDRYGRIRGDVMLNGELLTSKIVEAGLAWRDTPRTTRPASGLTPPLNSVGSVNCSALANDQPKISRDVAQGATNTEAST
jgi:endonuclease YncB( thermonuclease family)